MNEIDRTKKSRTEQCSESTIINCTNYQINFLASSATNIASSLGAFQIYNENSSNRFPKRGFEMKQRLNFNQLLSP